MQFALTRMGYECARYPMQSPSCGLHNPQFPHRGAINDVQHLASHYNHEIATLIATLIATIIRAIITIIRSLRWGCRALGFYPGGSPRPLMCVNQTTSLLHRPCAPPGKARSKVLDGSPYPDHKDEAVSWDCFLSCVQTKGASAT